MSVIWRDPPVHRGVPGVWEPVLRELMVRPAEDRFDYLLRFADGRQLWFWDTEIKA